MEIQPSIKPKETEDLYIHKHIHIHMSKLINVSDDVYETLKKMKGEKSFSEVIRERVVVINNRDRLLAVAKKFAGKDVIDETAMRDIKRAWKKWTDRYA